MKAALARAAYGGLLRAATPLYLARLWWRGRREPAYRLHWRERLGASREPAVPGALWVHAVSLGETHAAGVLVASLRRARPGLRLLLTHGTATGRAAGQAILAPGDRQAWLPFDTPGAVRRFLRHHRPALGVLMETEVWPQLLHAAAAQRVPMVLASARLSEKSARQGRRWSALLQPAVRSLALVLAQTADDARRLQQAGAREVRVCGNLKFDQTPSMARLAQGRQWRAALFEPIARPVVLAASTREGEEAALLAAWSASAPAAGPAPRPLLLLVPRHPQRFDAVAQLVHESGLTLQRRSAWADAPPPQAAQADVWLGDSMGEMALYYALADVALLGGSFAPLGGQNLIEAAACGCPVVMGPHTFNFADAAQRSEAAGAAVRVPDIGTGVARAIALCGDPDRPAMAMRAQAFAAAHRGAADTMARAIVDLLSAPAAR